MKSFRWSVAAISIFGGLTVIVTAVFALLVTLGLLNRGEEAALLFWVISFIAVFFIGAWLLLVLWCYVDAERRGMNGVLWALLVFIGHILALLIYLIVRTNNFPRVAEAETTQPCPSCQEPVAENFVFCPHCSTRLQAVCPACEKPVENTWLVCPHCGKKLTQTK